MTTLYTSIKHYSLIQHTSLPVYSMQIWFLGTIYWARWLPCISTDIFLHSHTHKHWPLKIRQMGRENFQGINYVPVLYGIYVTIHDSLHTSLRPKAKWSLSALCVINRSMCVINKKMLDLSCYVYFGTW